MATHYWVYKTEAASDSETAATTGQHGDEQLSGPLSEGAAKQTAQLLNQEVESDEYEYYADTPHNHTESRSVSEVFGPQQTV